MVRVAQLQAFTVAKSTETIQDNVRIKYAYNNQVPDKIVSHINVRFF